MPRPTSGLLLVAVGIAMALTGCGGSSRTVSASSLGKAEFVKRTDSICSRGRSRGLRYQPAAAAGQPEGKAVTAAIETNLLPALQDVIDEIYALGAPRGEESRVEAFLVALQDAVDAGEDLQPPSFERLEPLLAPPGKLALKIGLESCVYG